MKTFVFTIELDANEAEPQFQVASSEGILPVDRMPLMFRIGDMIEFKFRGDRAWSVIKCQFYARPVMQMHAGDSPFAPLGWSFYLLDKAMNLVRNKVCIPKTSFYWTFSVFGLCQDRAGIETPFLINPGCDIIGLPEWAMSCELGKGGGASPLMANL
jgi:hypothetical protein